MSIPHAVYFPEMLPFAVQETENRQGIAHFLNPGLPDTALAFTGSDHKSSVYYTPDKLPLTPAAARAWLEQTRRTVSEQKDLLTRELTPQEDFYTGTSQAIRSTLVAMGKKKAEEKADAAEEAAALRAQQLLLLALSAQQTQQQMHLLEQSVDRSWQRFDTALDTDMTDRSTLRALSGGAFSPVHEQQAEGTGGPASVLFSFFPAELVLWAFFQLLSPEISLFVRDKTLLSKWQEQGVTFTRVPDRKEYGTACLPGTVFAGLPQAARHSAVLTVPRRVCCIL